MPIKLHACSWRLLSFQHGKMLSSPLHLRLHYQHVGVMVQLHVHKYTSHFRGRTDDQPSSTIVANIFASRINMYFYPFYCVTLHPIICCRKHTTFAAIWQCLYFEVFLSLCASFTSNYSQCSTFNLNRSVSLCETFSNGHYCLCKTMLAC